MYTHHNADRLRPLSATYAGAFVYVPRLFPDAGLIDDYLDPQLALINKIPPSPLNECEIVTEKKWRTPNWVCQAVKQITIDKCVAS